MFVLLLLLFLTAVTQAGFNFNGVGSTVAFDKTTSQFSVNTPITFSGGVVKLNDTATATNLVQSGGTVTLTNNSLLIDTNKIDLTSAAYSVSGTTPLLTLSNGQIFSVSSGATVYPAVTVATGSSATIVGTPLFTSAVSLADATSTLTLALDHKLNQNIALNGGQIILQDDLSLADGVQLTGTGTVDLQSRTLKISGATTPWNNGLTFWRAKDIQLDSPLSLTNTWSFLTPASSPTDNISVINGNGNTLSLSGGANITVGDSNGGHTLVINDLMITGLADIFTTPVTATFVGLTKSQWDAISTAYVSSTAKGYGDSAYSNGFVALAGAGANDPFGVLAPGYFNDTNTIAVYDGQPGSRTPAKLYYDDAGNSNYFQLIESTSTPSLYDPSPGSFGLMDVGADGTVIGIGGGSSIYILTTSTTATNIGNPSSCRMICIADANHIYAASSSTIYVYSGSGTTWNTFATGFSNLISISASQDGVVWALSQNHFYKVSSGQTAGTATILDFTDANGNNIATDAYANSADQSYGRNALLSVKGSLSTTFHALVSAGNLLYSSTDGTNFSLVQPTTTLGSKFFYAISTGANGTIVFAPYLQTSAYNAAFAKYSGVQSTPGRKFLLYNSSTPSSRGNVVLSNCTLVLSGSYTHSTGEILINNDNCTLVTGGNKTFNIASSTAPLVINSVALIYETLGGNNVSPFATSTNAPTLVNGGTVRSAIAPVVTADTIVDAGTVSSLALTTNLSLFTPYTVGYNTWSNRIVVNNSAAPTAKTITIDGGSYYWYFPKGSGAVLTIANDVTVTLQNVTLKNFSLSNVSFGTSSSLVFGNGCVIELGVDQTLSTGTAVFNFAPTTGNTSKIRGQGQTLNLTGAQALQNSGAGLLDCENLNIHTSNATALACSNASGTIQLTNSNLTIDSNGLNYNSGSLIIDGWTRVWSSSTVSLPSVLAFYQSGSTATLTINAGAIFEVGRNCIFNYSCPTKTQFVMADNSSTLLLNDSSLDAYSQYFGNSNFGIGMRFTQGNLVVDNLVQFTASSTVGNEIEISAAANVEVLADGTLQVTGNVKYTT